MANYAVLKAAIEDVIKTNGNNEITGELLQESLIAMINSLGAEYQFAGVATVATNPGTPDHNVFYIAGDGLYSNFGATNVPKGCLGIFMYNGNWTYNVIDVTNYTLVNVNDLINQSTPFASASAARSAVPQQNRKPGLNITYLLSTGENVSMWVTEQFIGDDVEDWADADNWQVLGPVSIINQTVNVGKSPLLELPLLRYSGTTGSSYGWIQEVNIPSGVSVKNVGSGAVGLYAEKDDESDMIIVRPNQIVDVTFPITWIRGRAETDLPYTILVYWDKAVAATTLDTNMSLNHKVPTKEGKNLFDVNALGILVGKGIYNNLNYIISQDGVNISDYCNAKPSTAYYLSNSNDGAVASSDWYIEFFDEYKSPIGGIAVTKTFTTPANCAFIRFTYVAAYTSIMLNEGTSRGDYEAYDSLSGYKDDEITKNSKKLIKNGSVYDAFKVVSNGYNCIARFSGMTGTGYGWLQEVNIPSGVAVSNMGLGPVTLYDVKNGSNELPLRPGETAITTFAVTWIRGRTTTNLNYDVYVYADAELIKKIFSAYTTAGKQLPKLPGKNLFDVSSPDIIAGKNLNAAGGLTNNQYCSVSPFIPVKENTNYYLSKNEDAPVVIGNDYKMIFYDATLHALSISNPAKTFTTPANCAFIRFTYVAAYTSIMLNEGTSRGDYEEYNALTGYINSGAVAPAFRNLGLGYNCIARFSGTTGTGYDWRDKVNIPAGTTLHNVGTGDVTLYEYKDNDAPNIALHSNEAILTTFVITQIRGRSSTDKTYDIFAYADAGLALDAVRAASEVKAVRGMDGYVVKSDDLSSDLVLTDFPASNKFGDKYSFNCKVTSFDKLHICKGAEGASYSRKVTITNTQIILTRQGDAGTSPTTDTVSHGLTIEDMLGVNINISKESATITLQTHEGFYTHEFTSWMNGSVRGVVSVVNDGSTLTSCVLSATNSYYRRAIWLFGASYEGLADNTWTGQVNNMGYLNCFVNSYPGRDGAQTIAELRQALKFGCPKYLYYAGSNDLTLETFTANLNTVNQICNSNGITLIANCHADWKNINFSAFRAFVESLGCRYFNQELALHDPSKIWAEGVDTWYSGFMRADGVHVTELGAKALAMQAYVDFPEIMQYD